MSAPTRCVFLVRGIVQGVGFRPFVYRTAVALDLAGSVRNEPEGVAIEAEGPRAQIDLLQRALWTSAPPMARVESVDASWLPPAGIRGFAITASRGSTSTTLVPADVATCPSCLAEMCDSGDRRYGYPFINCTDCGPRYTLIRGMPYDRAMTTMATFSQCPSCLAEYTDPMSRRFHAEPNACPACGPGLSLLDGFGALVEAPDPLAEAVRRLRSGAILAVKGLGGFHLVCNARDATAVDRMRRLKQRDGKPFAVMSPDVDAIRAFACVAMDEADLLATPARPDCAAAQGRLVRSGRRHRAQQCLHRGDAPVCAFAPQDPFRWRLHRPGHDLGESSRRADSVGQRRGRAAFVWNRGRLPGPRPRYRDPMRRFGGGGVSWPHSHDSSQPGVRAFADFDAG